MVVPASQVESLTWSLMPVRIHLLDDEPAIQALVSHFLGEAGYAVDVLVDPLMALDAIHDGQYALVITNSVMDGPAGATLLAEMRQRHPALPLLHLDDQSQPRLPHFPSDVPTLKKPFELDALIDTVRSLAGG
jgi:DNA-binding response OmpR family regulator